MRRSPRLLAVVALMAAVVLGVAAASRSGKGTGPPEFVKGVLAGSETEAVTTLQWGPDGRLYVGQQNGQIRVLSVERRPPGAYRVTEAETIQALNALPNHDDDGRPNDQVTGRLLTGLVVAGPADAPVIYAVTSDPRLPGTSAPAEDLPDSNSGVLSRLDREGDGWRRHDLVRGLPRSKHDHTSNGLALDPSGSLLYVAQGGHTNKGAPSAQFNNITEYALSAAILSIDLATVGGTTYDLPTLDDPDRPGTADAGDPFGGANGRNQARLVPGGPVQIYAPGFRNPYDVVVTKAGRMYTIDNGANAGYGATPLVEGASCANTARPGGQRELDSLRLIEGPGYYGGHPNPTRADPANQFAGQSPVDKADPTQCLFRTGVRPGALVTFSNSTNGLTEYRGDLLAASFDNTIYRLRLRPDGTLERGEALFEDVDEVPLDVTAVPDDGPFPGTIWVGDVVSGSITVFEPPKL